MLRERQGRPRLAINESGNVSEPEKPVSRIASTSCSCPVESCTRNLITTSWRELTAPVIIRGLWGLIAPADSVGRLLADTGQPDPGTREPC